MYSMAQSGMSHTKGDALPHQLGGIQNFLHLRGTHPVARRLHHLITPANEIQKTFCVLAHGVT